MMGCCWWHCADRRHGALAGWAEISRQYLQLPVRIGAPVISVGLNQELRNPMYATSVGWPLMGRGSAWRQPSAHRGDALAGTSDALVAQFDTRLGFLVTFFVTTQTLTVFPANRAKILSVFVKSKRNFPAANCTNEHEGRTLIRENS